MLPETGTCDAIAADASGGGGSRTLTVTIQPVAGIQTLPLVSSVSASKGRRPCLAAVARADVPFGLVVVEGHPKVGGKAQIVIQPSADPAGQRAVPAADRAGRGDLGGGADQRRGSDQPAVGRE